MWTFIALQSWTNFWLCKKNPHAKGLIEKSKEVPKPALLKHFKVFSSCLQLLVSFKGQAWWMTLQTSAAAWSLFLCFWWIVCYVWMFYRIKLNKILFNKDKNWEFFLSLFPFLIIEKLFSIFLCFLAASHSFIWPFWFVFRCA